MEDEMRSYLDCFGCFMDQGLDVARRSGADEAQQRLILNEIARMFPSFDLETRPPVMSLNINQTIRNMTGVADPYADEKSDAMSLRLKRWGWYGTTLQRLPIPLSGRWNTLLRETASISE